MVQAGIGGVMVWLVFSWHTLGPLVPSKLCFEIAIAHLSIVADHVHPFVDTVSPFLSAACSRMTRSKQLKLVS